MAAIFSVRSKSKTFLVVRNNGYFRTCKGQNSTPKETFRLHLKREPVKSVTSNADKKDATAATATESYLELEAKAKVPTAQEWSLKVKTEPPVFLVSGGNFLSDFPATRIPKDIADKPFVDYELHIDKCSPTQVATGKGSVAKMAAAAAAAAAAGGQPAAKRGRKVAAK